MMKNILQDHKSVLIGNDTLNLQEDGFFILDSQGDVIHFNPPIKRLLPREFMTDRRLNINQLIDPKTLKEVWGRFRYFHRKDFRDHLLKLQIIDEKGNPRYFNAHMQPSYDQQGRLLNIYCLVRNIEKGERLKKEYQEQPNKLGQVVVDHNSIIRESELKFRALVDHSLTGIIIVTTKEIRFANRTFEKITGYTQEDIRTMSPWDMVHPDERMRIRQIGFDRFRKKNVRDYYETRWIRKDKTEIWVEVRATITEDHGEPAILANVVDITERKKAEDELQKREAELEVQSHKLEETNTALRVLLEQRNEDKIELQKNILSNVEKLVIPFIEKLENIKLESRYMAYVEIVKSNLNDIISPFLRELSSKHSSLTLKQIQVANLIKEGKTTKEIADLLCVSKATIDFHRDYIRKKLGLNKKKVNLRSYLLSLK